MDYAHYFAGKYISANLVEGLNKKPLTIDRVVGEAIEDLENPGQTKERMVIYFHKANRGWVVNRTNAECLVAMFGRDTKNWSGKRVVLKSEKVRVGGGFQPGIRVHGSPDIDADMEFALRLPRKRPMPYKLIKTGE